MIEPAYRYRCTALRVIDGDTFEFDIDLGLHIHAHARVRLYLWSAAEMNTDAGKAARTAAVEILMQPNAQLIIETHKDQQTFGRWLADVWVNGIPLSTLMLNNLHFGKTMG